MTKRIHYRTFVKYCLPNKNNIVMESKLLLPHRFNRIGWCLLLPFLVLAIAYLLFKDEIDLSLLYFEFSKPSKGSFLAGGDYLFNLKNNNFTDELIAIGLMIGLLLVAFSKEKIEDEWTAKLRLDALFWGVFINALLLFLAFVLLYNNAFWVFMNVNLFTPLLIFIIRFNYLKWKENRILA